MRTLEVILNGKKLCTAGVEDDGVLTAIVSSVVHRRGEATNRKHSRRGTEDLRLEVGGLIRSTTEQVLWRKRALRVGDDVRIRIGEAELASRPSRRERANPALVAKAKEKYLENEAKKLGWKIVKPGRLRTK